MPNVNAVRSPCPGLNSLANHGFINRNGKNISPTDLIAACASALNVDASFCGGAGTVALTASSNLLHLTFNLDDLKSHNFPIEHDGSLSRTDKFFGNVLPFNQTKWSQVLDVFGEAETISLELGGKAHLRRIQTERAENPQFVYTPRELVLANGETAVYLSVLGDPVAGNAPAEFVKIFFGISRMLSRGLLLPN